jgi:hypothetical protein
MLGDRYPLFFVDPGGVGDDGNGGMKTSSRRQG